MGDSKNMSTTYAGKPITTEGRVAGTQFSIELPLEGGDANLIGSLGFVLSGDGEDHGPMAEGQFHAFYPAGNILLDGPEGSSSSWWRQLPPHPGYSRWAPGSFVMRGTARAYFTGGYDRALQILFSDLWMIDLSSLFLTNQKVNAVAPSALEVRTMPASSSARPRFMTITSVVVLSTIFHFLRY